MSAAAPAPLVVSETGQTAAAALRKRVAAWRSGRENAGNLHGPIGSPAIWAGLEADGWLAVAVADGGEGQVPLRDLVELAEIWGGALLALPVVQTVLIGRWTRGAWPVPGAPREPLTFAIPAAIPGRRNRVLAPFGLAAGTVAFDLAGDVHSLGKSAFRNGPGDEFAATLPLPAIDAAQPAFLPAGHARDAAILYAATAVGCAATCLQRTASYSRERIVYAKPIGAYQAVRHLIVDMYRDVELARSGVAGAVLEESWPALIEACLDMAQRVVARAIQVHGGVGFTWDMGLHFHARHIMAVRTLVRALASTASRRA